MRYACLQDARVRSPEPSEAVSFVWVNQHHMTEVSCGLEKKECRGLWREVASGGLPRAEGTELGLGNEEGFNQRDYAGDR